MCVYVCVSHFRSLVRQLTRSQYFIRLSPCGCVMIDVPHLFRVSIVHQVYCRHIQLTMFVINVYSMMFAYAGLRPMLYCCAHRNVHLNPGEMHLQPESILNLTMKARCILQFILIVCILVV